MNFIESASTFADLVDERSLGLLLICTVILFVVFALVIGFAILYRQSSKRSREMTSPKNSKLEWTWTIATLIIFVGIFIWTAIPFVEAHIPPQNAEEILVVGKQWMWKFEHASGKRELNELHLAVGQPVVLSMTSEDVIHSLYVPEFRIKQDVLPGRYTKLWFEPTKSGTYFLLCTQYCGSLHAEMRGRVVVMPQAEFQKWLAEDAGENSSYSRGENLYLKLACVSCHGEDSSVPAPKLKNLFGSQVELEGGQKVIADENYIRESILYPDAKVVKNYRPTMPSYVKRLSEEELLDLIAYLKEAK